MSGTIDHIVFHIWIDLGGSVRVRYRDDSICAAVHEKHFIFVVADLSVNIVVPHIRYIRTACGDPVELKYFGNFIQRGKTLMNVIVDNKGRIHENRPHHIVGSSGGCNGRGNAALTGSQQHNSLRVYKIPFTGSVQNNLQVGNLRHNRHFRGASIAPAATAATEVKAIRCQSMRGKLLCISKIGLIRTAEAVGTNDQGHRFRTSVGNIGNAIDPLTVVHNLNFPLLILVNRKILQTNNGTSGILNCLRKVCCFCVIACWADGLGRYAMARSGQNDNSQ